MTESPCYDCTTVVEPADDRCSHCTAALWLHNRRYHIRRKITTTNLSIVYEATDTVVAGRRCTIKQIVAQSSNDLARMQNEVAILATSGLPFIPVIYDRWADGLTHFFAMEFITGTTLDKVEPRPWAAADVATFLEQLLGYLEQMHSLLILHRDIKPTNIMRATDGLHRNQYVLLDFNIAKNVAAYGSDTQPWSAGCTPGFASPEQERGGATTPRSDLYSLAATAYALLATDGRPPLSGVFQLTDLPPSLKPTLRAMLHPDAEQRPPDARAALHLLHTPPPPDMIDSNSSLSHAETIAEHITLVTPAPAQRSVLGCGRANAIACLAEKEQSSLLVASALGVYRYDLLAPLEQSPLVALPAVRRVAVVPPGDRLVVVRDGSVEIRRLRDGKLLHVLEDDPRVLADALIIAPNGATAAALSNGHVLVWRLSDGRILQRIAVPPDSYRVALDGATLAVASDQGVHLIRISDGVLLHTFKPDSATVTALMFTSNGATLAVAAGNHITLMRLASGEQIGRLPLATPATALAFDGLGERLAVAVDGQGMIWRFTTDLPPRPIKERLSAVVDLAFAPDGALLAVVNDGSVQLFRTRDGSRTQSLLMHGTGACALACPPIGRIVAATNGIPTLYRMADGALHDPMPLEAPRTPPFALAFAADGQTLAVGSGDALRLWRSHDGSLLGALPTNVGQTGGLAFADADTLVVATTDAIERWRLSDGTQLSHTVAGIPGSECVALAPDGSAVAISNDYSIKVWPIPGETPCWEQPNDGVLNDLALASGGTRLAVVTDAATQLWHVGDDEPITTTTFGGHGVVFSGDGRLLATLQGERIRLWHVGDDGLSFLCDLEGHTETVLDAFFSPDDQHLVSTALDGTLRIWTCDLGVKLADVERR